MPNVIEGEVIQLQQRFKDSDGNPLMPLDFGNGPLITVVDADYEILVEANAIPAQDPGVWVYALTAPILGQRDAVDVTVMWCFEHAEGTSRHSTTLTILPQVEHRISDIVFLAEETGTTFDIVVPWKVRPQDRVDFSISLNNNTVAKYHTGESDVELLNAFSDRTEYRLPIHGTPDRIEPYAVVAKYVANDKSVAESNRLTTYKMWPATPQMLVAASMVQDFCDRARLDNVIPELEYTQSDLLLYLYRGLAMFNSLPPRATAFNGTNMQGQLLDAWVVCSCTQALSAQFLAEGSLAFDFSGQTVSLNMDRSPAIESTLGRLESHLNTVILPFKKLIGRAGVISGDGSQGGKFIDGARNFGMLGVTNAPTTRLASGMSVNSQRIWMKAHYGIRR